MALTFEQKQAIELLWRKHFTYDQISSELKVTRNSVGGYLRREGFSDNRNQTYEERMALKALRQREDSIRYEEKKTKRNKGNESVGGVVIFEKWADRKARLARERAANRIAA